jgi:hypothetical protein
MVDFLINEDNSDFPDNDVHADDINIDHFAINLPVADDRTDEVLKSGSWLGTPSAYQQTRLEDHRIETKFYLD